MSNLLQELCWNDGIEESCVYKVRNIYTKPGAHLYKGKKICELTNEKDAKSIPIKAQHGGVVSKLLIKIGEEITKGKVLIEIRPCTHPTVLGNICCDCGLVLDEKPQNPERDKAVGLVSMLHSVPDLKVSQEEATRLGNEDIKHLLDKRKLVLLVDLDQTLIHTTNDNIPPKLKDVFHFQLVPNGPWYHTRLRPFTASFLRNISRLYELHICTFGVREYAHCIAHFLDPDHKLFGDRILSRNECLDPMSKKANLSSLFPCGDNLVCIIDDRSDVWNFAPNVVQVLPYHFFQHTGDINAPPGLQKKENDNTEKGFDFSSLDLSASTKGKSGPSKEEDKSKESSEKGELKEESNESGSEKNTKRRETPSETENGKNSEAEEKEENLEGVKDESSTDPEKETPTGEGEKPNGDKEELATEEGSPGESKDKGTSDEREELTGPGTSGKELESGELEGEGTDSKTTGALGAEEDSKATVEIKDSEGTDGTPHKENTKLDHKNTLSSDEEDDDAAPVKDPEDAASLKDPDTMDVEDSDDYLLYLEDILKKLHTAFYEQHDPLLFQERNALPDLKDLVPKIRKKVLAGVHLVLSGIVPQNTDLKMSKVFHIATSLGATINEKIIARAKKEASQPVQSLAYTTHLIAANLHTEKVHQAKRLKNIKIVTPNWLWSCAERWEHVDERLFELTEDAQESLIRNPPMHCLVPVKSKTVETLVFPEPAAVEKECLFNSLNPFAFLSNDETKSMEQEVDNWLSDEDSNQAPSQARVVESESSESTTDDSALENESQFDDDDDEPKKKRKRRGLIGHDEDDDEEEVEEEEEELPSIRFRQGSALPSDESDPDSGDEDINTYGDILAQELMRD